MISRQVMPAASIVRIVDPLGDSEWDNLVSSHPDSTIFHTATWAKVLVTTFGHRPVYLELTRASNLSALLPLMEISSHVTGRRGVCLPFIDCCNPLIFEGSDISPILHALSSLSRQRNWKYFELRCGGNSLHPVAPALVTLRGHNIDLRSGIEVVFSRFASSVRRAIRKAERSGLNVCLVSSHEAVLKFYRLHTLTRKRQGLPPLPLSYFLRVYDSVIEPGLGFMVMVQKEARPVGAAVFFIYGKRAVYKFAASDLTFQNLRPNNLAMWEGIKSLMQGGAETLHLGATSMEGEGLRRFKLSWGSEEE
ncbi:MAG TPA: GNAT family N-acetyltransferase, partial [Chthoniobacterales bacterium]|nr:GNAT family N-acetyltransferase [Chthoniobacterales bacterium]